MLQCTEYCGKDHSKMMAKVYVDTLDKFEEWMKNGPPEWETMNPVELGRQTYEQAGCNSCHSVDGSKGQGPTWKGIWGKVHEFTDGSKATVDENYVLNSINNPQEKIVKGYEGIMPTYQGVLREKQIKGVIAYLKSLQ
jgi:cytochrome c oxidase subunit 2